MTMIEQALVITTSFLVTVLWLCVWTCRGTRRRAEMMTIKQALAIATSFFVTLLLLCV